jgi:hypothetical protein
MMATGQNGKSDKGQTVLVETWKQKKDLDRESKSSNTKEGTKGAPETASIESQGCTAAQIRDIVVGHFRAEMEGRALDGCYSTYWSVESNRLGVSSSDFILGFENDV